MRHWGEERDNMRQGGEGDHGEIEGRSREEVRQGRHVGL